MPCPDSMYQAPCGLDARLLPEPELEQVRARTCRRARRSATASRRSRLSASTALGMPLIFAGSSSGPMMTKSLYMTSRRFRILPSSTYFRSRDGACTSATSASPRAASASACPVPTEIVLTVSPVFFSNSGTSTSRRPESWVLVVVERMTVVDCARAGVAHTEHSTTRSRRSSMRFPLSPGLSSRREPRPPSPRVRRTPPGRGHPRAPWAPARRGREAVRAHPSRWQSAGRARRTS